VLEAIALATGRSTVEVAPLLRRAAEPAKNLGDRHS